MKHTKETLEGIEFFDLMQAYRIADPTNQDRVCKKFEDVKDWIIEKFIKQNTEMHEALKEHYNVLRKHPEILNNELYKQ